MAIQISEKLLSEKARKALSNAVSKSQFLRDAIEFYVNSMDAKNTDNFSIQGTLIKEIEELKNMVALLNTNDFISGINENIDAAETSLSVVENKEDSIKHDIVVKKHEQIIPISAAASRTKTIEKDKEEYGSDLDDIPECFRDI